MFNMNFMQSITQKVIFTNYSTSFYLVMYPSIQPYKIEEHQSLAY